MRARYPDREDFVDRDGVGIYYEVYENDGPTVVLVPTTTIWHSQQWKAQIHYLARHFRVVTFDGRGNGKSDKPESVEAYRDEELIGDIVAALDATETERGILVALCHAVPWAIDIAVRAPERVLGLVAIAPGVPHIAPSQPHYVAAGERWGNVLDRYQGWEMCNRHFWLTDYPTWIDFFFSELLPEPHSTKQHEDAVFWALGTTGPIRVSELAARSMDAMGRDQVVTMCRQVTQPVLVIHGDRDQCQSVERGRALAELTGGTLVVLEGGGHAPHARDPVKVNLAIKDFVDRIAARQVVPA
ncbi:MAG TPA: alpha/beta hydrolase [Acidimicrobiia bacterium]|nr:alpha/beta hydrolase [Acidimicrobiia bacterium]